MSQWSGHPNANDPEVRDLYLGVYAAFGIGQGNGESCDKKRNEFIPIVIIGVTLFANSLAMAIGCLYAAKFLHANLLIRTLRLPMEFFDTTPLGRIVNR